MSNLVKVETYDGTIESAKLALRNLRVKDDFYHFNVMTSQLTLIKFRLILNPGDSYQYLISPIPEKFESIG